MKRGNARRAKGAGHPCRVGVNGKPNELLVLAEAGGLPRGGTSRMNREVHVRICGRLGVKFPGEFGDLVPFRGFLTQLHSMLARHALLRRQCAALA